MIGFPDETRRDLLQTLQFGLKAAWLGVDDIPLFPFSPYPGTLLYDELRRDGMIPPPDDDYLSGLGYMDLTRSASMSQHIGTAELNRWLQEAVRLHEPAMAQRGTRRRPLKFFYATQTATRPPTFVLFCTEPESVQPAYRRFLENRLRETFDFEGTPVRLRLRPRHEGRSS